MNTPKKLLILILLLISMGRLLAQTLVSANKLTQSTTFTINQMKNISTKTVVASGQAIFFFQIRLYSNLTFQ